MLPLVRQNTVRSLGKQSDVTNIDSQSKCAQQAKIFFDFFESTDPDSKNKKQLDYYENHFNEKLNKCFILLHQFPIKDGLASDFLFDAIEKKEYAEYIYSDSISDKDYCFLSINNSVCTTKIEFNNFVNNYMSE